MTCSLKEHRLWPSDRSILLVLEVGVPLECLEGPKCIVQQSLHHRRLRLQLRHQLLVPDWLLLLLAHFWQLLWVWLSPRTGTAFLLPFSTEQVTANIGVGEIVSMQSSWAGDHWQTEEWQEWQPFALLWWCSGLQLRVLRRIDFWDLALFQIRIVRC